VARLVAACLARQLSTGQTLFLGALVLGTLNSLRPERTQKRKEGRGAAVAADGMSAAVTNGKAAANANGVDRKDR
jgi:hypothetical protein